MTGVSPRTTASMNGSGIDAIWPAGKIRAYTSMINSRSAAYSCGTRRNAAICRRSNRTSRTLRRKRSKTPGYNKLDVIDESKCPAYPPLHPPASFHANRMRHQTLLLFGVLGSWEHRKRKKTTAWADRCRNPINQKRSTVCAIGKR